MVWYPRTVASVKKVQLEKQKHSSFPYCSRLFSCSHDDSQEALFFLPLSICLSIAAKKNLYKQLLPQFLSYQSKSWHKCCRHTEDVHLPVWEEKIFDKITAISNLEIFKKI